MEGNVVYQEYLLFSLNGVQFVAWPYIKMKTLSPDFKERCLVTIIPIESGMNTNEDWVESLVKAAVKDDDVFNPAFLSGIIFFGASAWERKNMSVRDTEYLFSVRNKWTRFVGPEDEARHLVPGPYVLENGLLWKVLRLYEDTVEAFTVGLRTLPDNSVSSLQLQGMGQKPALAVPSRLHCHDISGLPLQGCRVTVKDIFDVRGLRTGLGSRGYSELYPPASRTAPGIQKLLDAGVNLVGMSKMCSMVLKAPPTQCVDVSAPFNPRGDGYLSPSGGSSGQGAAVVAYEWIDFAIASDSTFSGRMPAQANGCFSLRPTVGCLSTEGMWSGVPQFDTPCLFGRDISKFEHFASTWYGETLPNRTLLRPRALISSLEYLHLSNSSHQQILKDFVNDLGRYLGLHIADISIPSLWEEKPPQEANGRTLREYLSEDVATSGYIYTFWQKISSFYNRYRSEFGKLPFIPGPKGIHLWDRAKSVTPEQHEKALETLNVYKAWLLSTYLRSESQDTILVLPLGEFGPSYRDEWPSDPGTDQQLWEPLLVAPIVGAPELVVPVGQVNYKSRISGRDEPLPVCVSIMGLPGSDLELIQLVQKFLAESGRPTKVEVGRAMFVNHP